MTLTGQRASLEERVRVFQVFQASCSRCRTRRFSTRIARLLALNALLIGLAVPVSWPLRTVGLFVGIQVLLVGYVYLRRRFLLVSDVKIDETEPSRVVRLIQHPCRRCRVLTCRRRIATLFTVNNLLIGIALPIPALPTVAWTAIAGAQLMLCYLLAAS